MNKKNEELRDKCTETLNSANEMLNECITRNPEKMTDDIRKLIENAIAENNIEIENIENKKQDFSTTSTDSLDRKVKYNVDMDKLGQCDYNRNNGFLIEINSQLFNPDPWLVRNFSSNSGTSNELFIEIAEPNTLCIQALLDLSMKNDVRYTIRKKILSARLDVLYTVIYNECKVCNYVESALDYRNDGIRTYKISFNYNEHEYEY